ncbi:hypothetical protein [Mycolicibacterium thermoresistibile]|mgnify:CR=1 FL=1|jgi:hypothetical protein|uniref:Secreted protein n=2 Tax=Mycolicibacterium thermoresistibile TaxID=1797 RepID=G7CLS7_MYCT3|nr:hypothetical protein [Mycolicibacterium thermoresistibile]EHI10880.1 hypothetical protein KEK_19848 [Mycolicibacterium thermoresistibile ATCC 19527]MCV7188355.1 hypothetical protein [Mycolicibacterium thermoresistibile]GAT13437.1 hypothetical protein RMCT_0408 [Mycolicibacterium thermoresistibile]SNW18389.1 Uncharacterised protein [Mycolicibacterium thermoresistibile]
MIRELLVAAAVGAAAVMTAPLAAVALAPAAGADNDNIYFDEPGRYPNDVPGMNYEARLAAPCYSWERHVFGRGPGGEPLQCKWIPNQWPPVYTGFWQASYPLHGVQEIGAPCPGPQAAAQSPDGRPMLCLGARGWQPGSFTGDGFFPM